MFRSPTRPVKSDKEPPSALLGSLTRKRNEITELLPDPTNNLSAIKSHYNVYLERLEALHEACGTDYQDWLRPNLISIGEFRDRVENLIHPRSFTSNQIPLVPITARSVRSHASLSSKTSSLRLRLAEEKAAHVAKTATIQQQLAIDNEERKWRREHDDKMFEQRALLE